MVADDLWDDLFHGLAFEAFIAEARAVQGWPESEAVRRRAYQLYEEDLARKGRESVG